MEGDEGGILSKLSNEKPLFLLKVKIKQNPGSPNKEYNTIFKRIHPIIRAYSRIKKICIDRWFWNLYYILGRLRTKRGVGELVFQIYFGGLSVGATPIKFCKFYSHFSLKQYSQHFYTKLLNKYEHFFFLKTDNRILNWVPLSLSWKTCFTKNFL